MFVKDHEQMDVKRMGKAVETYNMDSCFHSCFLRLFSQTKKIFCRNGKTGS